MVGAVYDRGYRGYQGERGGRRAARAALFVASIRRALGIRRSWRQKVAPALLLAIATVPAIVFVGVGYVTRDTPASDFEWITYHEYVGVSSTLLVFVALTAPDIMCPDRRQRVLPLLFARPLTGRDYVLAKVGAMFAIVFAFSFLPQVVLFVGQMLVSEDGALTYARDNAEVLWQVPLAVAVLSLYYAVLGVAIASMTSRRIIAGAVFVGVLLVTSIVSTVIVESSEGVVRQESPAYCPPTQVTTEDGDVVLIPCEEQVPTPGGFPSQTDEYYVTEREPSAGALINLLMLPLMVRDLVFLGELEADNPMSGLEGGGLYALLLYSAIVLAAFAVLLWRYSEVER
jgi:ABC-2 type transport system permease protein